MRAVSNLVGLKITRVCLSRRLVKTATGEYIVTSPTIELEDGTRLAFRTKDRTIKMVSQRKQVTA